MLLRASLFAAAALAAPAAFAGPVPQPPPNAQNQTPAFPGQTRAEQSLSRVAYRVEVVATGLQYPWAISFLPDGRPVVTEKPGRIRVIDNGVALPPVEGVPAVNYAGQGGLLDLIVVPVSATKTELCYTFSQPATGGSRTAARCATMYASGSNIRLGSGRTLWQQTPIYGGNGHYGSRINRAPNGDIYITNGDRQDGGIRGEAQNPKNGIGKMVRVTSRGAALPDNPTWGTTKPSKVFTLGHRNPQGAAIHPTTGELWTVEHGPQGGDELNVIRGGGKNYGWPVISYGVEYGGGRIGEGTQKPGMEQPVYYWDPVIAPGGMTFYTGSLFPRWQNSLFIGAMGQQKLVRLELSGDRVTGEEHFSFGERIRDVEQGPDGALYLVTDSANGRVLKLTPQ